MTILSEIAKIIAPQQIEKTTRISSIKIVPSRDLSLEEKIAWHMRRLDGKLLPSDPEPKKIERKAVRIILQNQGNGVIAESKLTEAGFEAFSAAPYSVDVFNID